MERSFAIVARTNGATWLIAGRVTPQACLRHDGPAETLRNEGGL